MNRFKLIVLLVVLGIVSVLLAQNRQPLYLKFFCPDVSGNSCLYRTPTLPLAAWIGLFAIAGVISSLIWQFLNRLATPKKTRLRDGERANVSDGRSFVDPSVPPTQPEYLRDRVKTEVKTNNSVTQTPPYKDGASSDFVKSDWEQPTSEDWELNELKNPTQDKPKKSVTFEKEPPNSSQRNVSDSVYSYGFEKTESKKKPETASSSKKVRLDDVYDANYRTINNPQQKDSRVDEEDDEEWI